MNIERMQGYSQNTRTALTDQFNQFFNDILSTGQHLPEWVENAMDREALTRNRMASAVPSGVGAIPSAPDEVEIVQTGNIHSFRFRNPTT